MAKKQSPPLQDPKQMSPLDWDYHLIPVDKKDATWFSKLISAYSPYMGAYFNNNGWFAGYPRNELLRLYAEGMQPEDYYKNLFDPQKALALNERSQFNYVNIDYKIVSYIPKLLRIMFAKLDQLPLELEATATDPIAQNEREQAALKLKIAPRLDRKLNALAKAAGTQPMKSGLQQEVTGSNSTPTSEIGDMDFNLEDDEELKLYMSLNYKQEVELAQELSLKAVFNQQELDEKKKRIIWDSLIYGKAATRCYTSAYTGLPCTDNLLLQDISVSYHERADYKDMNAWKYIKWMSLNQFINFVGSQVDEEEIRYIFKHAVKTWGVMNNSGNLVYEWDYSKVNRLIFDRVRVGVSYIEIKSTDVLDYESAKTKDGKTKSRKLSSEEKLKWKESEVIKYYGETIYTGYFIVGITDKDGFPKVYNFERMANTVREYGKEQMTRFSLHIYDYGQKSILEQMIPHADEIQLASLKLQHELLAARPSNWSWNVNALNDVILGNERIDGRELMRLFFQTGGSFHKTLNEDGTPIVANANAVHMRLENGLSKSFGEYANAINYQRDMMESIIGYNPVTAGAAPEARASATGQKIASVASDNATYFLQAGLQTIIKNIGLHTSLMIQNICRYKGAPYEALKNMVGEMNLNVIESMGKLHLHQFGISLRDAFTVEEKQDFIQDVSLAYSRSDSAVDFSDLLLARFMPSWKESLAVYSLRAKKKKNEAMQMQQQQQQVEMQMQQQLTQIQMQLKQMEMQTSARNTDVKAQALLDSEEIKNHGKIQNQDLAGQQKSQHINQETQKELLKESMKQEKAAA